ncbi:lipoprotein lipase-like isoform X2 [Pristis pectinata]|uniref:lipoprotein lipase-like isoform X2 n=1 Tax=Pristis pectinata TaxID=685728 RepID=UPI00223D6D64|nr:lipoprotein lipase-like isoform X2 [Pristis pectinata]XP_051893858.1 lipoprotein lipase-like isoform X2 [Pristis pectinata]
MYCPPLPLPLPLVLPLLLGSTLLPGFVETGDAAGALELQTNDIEDLDHIKTRFSLRSLSAPSEDECYIVAGNTDSLAKCSFNTSSKTFFIIHGWSVSGMFETWIEKMVVALYRSEPDANILVVDWLNRAHQHYPIAAQNTRLVGQDIAKLINWLEKRERTPASKMHLIGYSLGAHVAGFAGSRVTNKLGRITGLDPAGPVFEGLHAQERLSPDDATFVDVLHTFTRESLGMSIGIRQPVGHVDIYPNGGSFQPGCDLQKAVNNIAMYGIYAFSEAVKCEHERSIHLFIDSLLHEDQPCIAFRCGSHQSFEKGMCLNCRKNRCNALGYSVTRVHTRRVSRMYLKTRAEMPFRVYHYQLKIHFSSRITHFDIDPTLSVSLHGTRNDVENLQIETVERFSPNKTYSFLVVTEVDIGDLLLIKFRWESSLTWNSLWKRMKNSISWYKLPLWSTLISSDSDIQIRRIRVKSGETQKKMVFCLEDSSASIAPSQEVIFVSCPARQESTPTTSPRGQEH